MFLHVREIVEAAERATIGGELVAAVETLRTLSLDEFGEVLLSMPNQEYPNLAKVLPAMASTEVQTDWTGNSGYVLLKQSLTFVRAVWYFYERFSKSALSDAEVLDYGCGYGRLLRLMLYFCNPEKLTGLDPWDKSIELCRAARIPANLAVSDYLPTSLPVSGRTFDLVYAFSVFTHTSLRATKTALTALHAVTKPGGLLVATIRPIEYWDVEQQLDQAEHVFLTSCHQEQGFAFSPHNRNTVDGDITYGDTSVSPDVFAKLVPGWILIAVDRSLEDPYQRILVLQRV